MAKKSVPRKKAKVAASKKKLSMPKSTARKSLPAKRSRSGSRNSGRSARLRKGRVGAGFKNNAGLEFAAIPPGTFMMGASDTRETALIAIDECPVHKVTLPRQVYMSIYPVTQAQFVKVMGENPSVFKGDRLPVEGVTWEEAVAFCNKLSAKPQEKSAGRRYRLPTEAEWEYACRAGTKGIFSFGNDYAKLNEYGWYEANSDGKTHPVGQKKPNPWGLYDMHENVTEWCQDWYGDYPESPAADPKGPSAGTQRVGRGGDYQSYPAHCGSACRCSDWPAKRYSNQGWGFRVVCDVPA
jgi:formylglycine-generating enzyme required for sulfatase activity